MGVTVNGKWFRIYVNNKLCSQKTLARNMVRSRARVYVSDPWHRPVNAWVWNMRYKRGNREKRCRMERGFCVKRNGHDQNHGVVNLNSLYGIKGIEVVMYTQEKLLGEITPIGIDVGSSQNARRRRRKRKERRRPNNPILPNTTLIIIDIHFLSLDMSM